jgi:hypothetical protein
MMLVMLWLLRDRRARKQSQHQHQRAPNFSVNLLQPDYLYLVWSPGELIQIKLGVDLPRVNRGKGTFRQEGLAK